MTTTAAVEDFLSLDIRCGRVVEVAPFPEARKPAWKLTVDFGPEVGTLRSSAQLTKRYDADELVGTLVLGVVNFPPRRIAGFTSECLILGVVNPEDPGDVVLIGPREGATPIGWRLG